jgi:hypothetical protein
MAKDVPHSKPSFVPRPLPEPGQTEIVLADPLPPVRGLDGPGGTAPYDPEDPKDTEDDPRLDLPPKPKLARLDVPRYDVPTFPDPGAAGGGYGSTDEVPF